jgi:TetR/AcrR family transcriptional regulator, mexJK operon transcriptional repressor
VTIEAIPARMAEFGVYRSPDQRAAHVRHAVSLFLRGVLPR